MRNNNQYTIELLIDYYQSISAINDAYTDLDNNNDSNRYKQLAGQLVIIRQALIDKDLTNIYSICTPIRELFINEGHFSILEDIIEFYKRNTDAYYDIAEAEEYLKNHTVYSVPIDFTDMQKVTSYIEQCITTNINTALAKASEDLSARLTDISKQPCQITNN